ncbi:MAG: hypothetical protein NTU73_15090, partial [Ignavibacteriae bacterium]|nr:hypothetical protein [Ignavibacteriota bacterium]
EIVKLKTISSHELTDLILKIPVNKQVMMLDICGAGGFGGLVSKEIAMNEVKPKDVPSSAQTRAIDRMKDRAGMFILAASTDDKSSYEASRYSQGLLTYSLLDGMRGGCLKDNIYIDVMTMFNCSRDKVKQLAKEIGREQTPMIIPPSDASSFDIGIITPETIEKIPISLVKPIVIKCDIKENKKYKDNWGITVKLNAFLQTESDKENSLFEFKNIESLPDAFQIAGGYEVNSDVLTINIIIYKGDRELENFLLKGNSTEADIIIKKVYEKLIKYLNK